MTDHGLVLCPVCGEAILNEEVERVDGEEYHRECVAEAGLRADGGVSLARIDDLATEAMARSREGDDERTRELLREIRQLVHAECGGAP